MGQDSHLLTTPSAVALFREHWKLGDPQGLLSVPGRVNLIGEHIDYHGLQVLPMAIQRRITIAFRPRQDAILRAISQSYNESRFQLTAASEPSPNGDWANYLKAAARSANTRWTLTRGLDASITSDLPSAAGLSSSSSLLVGMTLALLAVNDIHPAISELMDVLPEAEHFVGTRGGGMDHAAVLASEPGCALLVRFNPVELAAVPIPPDWAFLVAHSLTTAEKSGPVRGQYNARRTAGINAMRTLGLESYPAALQRYSSEDLMVAAARLPDEENRAFLHVITEAARVEQALAALRKADIDDFGRLLNASHASLRDRLRVSNPSLDELVRIAVGAGAAGARLTGAGFGGCAIILCKMADCERVRGELVARFYSHRVGFDPGRHLFFAKPSAGALHV
jgi:galactokinase